jgi:hypothetical protein
MKKLVLPIIALVIGLAAGYFISKKRHQSFYEEQKAAFIERNKVAFGLSPNTVITDQINRMRDEYRAESSGLFLGTNGKSLNGFHIKRAELDVILGKKNPDGTNKYEGISFYLGKHPSCLGQPKRLYTLMFMGSMSGTPAVPSYVDDPTTVYDEVDICPDKCGGF